MLARVGHVGAREIYRAERELQGAGDFDGSRIGRRPRDLVLSLGFSFSTYSMISRLRSNGNIY